MLREWIERNFKGDLYIWFIVLVFSIMSVLVVYSATGSLAYQQKGGNTEYYLFKHGLLVVVSLGAMWFFHRINYRYYARSSQFALWISVPLLIAVIFFGRSVNSATRQFEVLGQSFQPSDLAKLALIASIAAMLARKQQRIEDIKRTLVPIMVWCGLICGLIAVANFSTAALLFATCVLLMLIGRVPWRQIMRMLLVGLLAGTIALAVGQRLETVISRFKAFFDTEQVPYQAEQSYIAVATGGLVGKGIGHSAQRNMLPNAYNDFIYAIIIEEYGMVGGIVVILLYLFLLYRSMRIVADSNKAFGGLLAAGLSFSLVLQAFAHMAVSVGLVPVTGQPLPLLSMGGTSLLFTGVAIGIIISVSRGDVKESRS
ncbi:MAG: FtsW/RodA/SpoVE family cell cycle protein [Cytophagales bacterium]|jgi:cell division protein FtsW|nr:FtsW/RodA/SpoVE family cell cycle protein [Cytophagales bacterium]